MDFFDLHCDTLTTAMFHSADLTERNLDISFPINPEIKRHCQCFAVFCPDTVRGEDAFNYYTMVKHYFAAQLEKYPEYFEQVHSGNDIERITSAGKTAAIFTVEGGAVLGGKLENVEKLHNDGVKMMTLTWNGENELGCGSSDQDFGLKPFGVDAVKEMERLGMVIDVSHLSDAGLSDVFKNVGCAVAASHSNLRSVCGHRRNLKDEQFREIVRRSGIVGINFYKSFLNDDGEKATLGDMVKHIEHMLVLGGENAVCMGSDYDGCDVVSGIEKFGEAVKLEKLLSDAFGSKIAEKILWKNANDFFTEKVLK